MKWVVALLLVACASSLVVEPAVDKDATQPDEINKVAGDGVEAEASKVAAQILENKKHLAAASDLTQQKMSLERQLKAIQKNLDGELKAADSLVSSASSNLAQAKQQVKSKLANMERNLHELNAKEEQAESDSDNAEVEAISNSIDAVMTDREHLSLERKDLEVEKSLLADIKKQNLQSTKAVEADLERAEPKTISDTPDDVWIGARRA